MNNLSVNQKNSRFHCSLIEALILFIEREIKEELTLDYLATTIGYSAGHLRRSFKMVKGISLAKYIRRRKTECAANEIIMSSRFIVDIAVEYGFSSQASFSRTFKSVTGVTPKEYRV
ncbi:helix-turn-helix transcriptional regulator [Erwiniaceae bacterium L1_54_3]|uniref:helix-turn-helix transcriptional regulator n=1 Tax=Candidatus Pantoea formicae TaxID=2608355 RepID=UPI00141DFC19|nr:helix-turn-helix transcriptional regulator [Erwiniaceae bacterium L1_54_3]